MVGGGVSQPDSGAFWYLGSLVGRGYGFVAGARRIGSIADRAQDEREQQLPAGRGLDGWSVLAGGVPGRGAEDDEVGEVLIIKILHLIWPCNSGAFFIDYNKLNSKSIHYVSENM